MSRGNRLEHFVHAAFGLVRASRIQQTQTGRKLFIAGYFQYKRYLEDSFSTLQRNRPEIFQGGDILDIGANVGYTAALFAEVVSNGHKIYAFEPEPFNFELLNTTIAQRKLQDKVVSIQAAVGAENGSVELWINPVNPGDHRVRTPEFEARVNGETSVTVPLLTIDRFVRDRNISSVCFIKIDVQGFELAVCQGMEQTLADNPRAVVAVEYMPAALQTLGFRAADLLHWFRERGFEAYSVETGAAVRGIPKLEGSGYVDLLMERGRAS